MATEADPADRPEGAPPGRRRRRAVRHGARGVLVMVVVVAAVVTWLNRDTVVATLTHRIGGPSQTWSPTPLPPELQPDLRLAVAGDVGDGGFRELETAAAIVAQSELDPYDALVLLGDNVYPAGDPVRIQQTVYGPFGPLLERGTELFAVLGNHDVAGGFDEAQVEALGMPGRWYSVTRGDLLLVALDSTRSGDAAQRAWLEETLRTSTATWKVVALHHPPYSSGYHGSSTAARTFVPLFVRYGVQLVLSGHEHDYQRSEPLGGVTYLVTGAASRTRRTGRDDFTAVAYATHHYVDLGVYRDHLLVRAIDQDGEQFDEVVIPARPVR